MDNTKIVLYIYKNYTLTPKGILSDTLTPKGYLNDTLTAKGILNDYTLFS